MAHLFISAAHKSSGKTTLSIGLTAAFSGRGLTLQTFKKGPDYIDPLWLSQAAGRDCINLDFYTTARDEIHSTFAQAMQGRDLGLIEGNKGLYDGLDLDGSNSNAALAKLLQAPVILVIDARGMTRGIAPLILGYQAFDTEIRIAGVILNKVGGARHESKLRQVIEHYTDVPVVGAVHWDDGLQIDERHLGLMPSNESEQARATIDRLGEAVSRQVDLDRLLDIARCAPLIEPAVESTPRTVKAGSDLVIAYPRDRAFGFYYPGDLARLRQQGVRLVSFDSLSDSHLPQADGLFIGGGFPEVLMQELHDNSGLRRQIREFVEAGGPVYAECGGLMYLCRSIDWNGHRAEMVGAIPADVLMHAKPQGRGYVRLRETADMPWPGVDGASAELTGHEFHYSALENLDPGVRFAYRVERGTGIDGDHDGLVWKNVLASYSHLRDVGGNHWTERFVRFVRECKSRHNIRE